MNIDIQNHYIPRGFFDASRRGREWYGARLEENAQGQQIVILNGTPAPLTHSEECLRLLNIWASPEERIRVAKEQADVDVQALCIYGYFFNYHLDAKTGASFCREVNEEIAELQNAYPANFVGLAMLPWQDTKVALKELEYATKDLGLRGVCTATHINGRNLDDPDLFPILEAVASEELFIFCHPGYPVLGQERMSRYLLDSTIGVLGETALAIMSLIYGRVLDRCPNLKICFGHGGLFAHSGIGRLSYVYHTRPMSHTMERPPEEYLGQLYYDCNVHTTDALRFLVDRVGTDHVLLGTDFPLPGIMAREIVPLIRNAPFLTGEDKENILGANVAPLLGITSS
ncbi:amidohydrolase family protein [Chloroflexota bacterium]